MIKKNPLKSGVVWESRVPPMGMTRQRSLRGADPVRFRVVALIDHGALPHQHIVCVAYAEDACGAPAWHLVTNPENQVAILADALRDFISFAELEELPIKRVV